MQHLATHQTDILIRLALRCDDVSAQEGDLVSVRTGHTRQLDLRLDIEPVPRLGLNGRRPAACHFVEDPGHDGVEEPHGASRVRRTVRKIPPASYLCPFIRASNSSLRSPAKTGWL